MGIGRVIRGLFGPYERQISELYRSIFVDIDSYVQEVRDWVPDPQRILEVGCGEGAVTERLASAYPDAEIVATDIDPRAGRLYRGRAEKVRFMQASIEELAARETRKFDLVVLSDVLHHVPMPMRQPLLTTIRALLAPGGSLAFKEWERTRTPIYWLCYFSDRWITGDRIHYLTRSEMHDQIDEIFGREARIAENRVPPWRNNISTLVRP